MKLSFTFISSLFFFLCFQHLLSQQSPPFRYFVGQVEPDTGWMNKDFDDATWLAGQGSIGWGDGDDSIVIDTSGSLYIRYYLDSLDYYAENMDLFKGILLAIDFDDAFVAYLNGRELFRVNMEEGETPPAHTQTAIRSHEATNYRWLRGGDEGFFLDTTFLDDYGLDTMSVLAFQVHNDSSKGSDLSFHLGCHFLPLDYGGFLHIPYLLDSTQLPILVMETDEFGFEGIEIWWPEPVKKKIYPHMGIIDNGPGEWNKPGDSFTGYDGRIMARFHGNSTLGRPKHSFRIETQDSEGENLNVPLLGLPEENDWVLYSSNRDFTFVRNVLVYSLGRAMGHYSPRTRYCQLILNGDYQGLYILTERIKPDKNRVDIKKLRPEENTGVELTGGYILRMDPELEVFYPDPDEIAPEQEAYIFSYYDSCMAVLETNHFRDTLIGYHKYFDVPSMIDYILLNELTLNFDSYSRSTYFYKNRDDIDSKFYLGPVWDYDVAMHTFGYNEFWRFSWESLFNIRRFLQDEAFFNAFVSRWQELRIGMLHTDSVCQRIDQFITPIQSDIDLNFKTWSVSDQIGTYPMMNFEQELDSLKNWLKVHMEWMDSNIHETKEFLEIYPELELISEFEGNVISVYPNPFSDQITIQLNLPETEYLWINVQDISGRTVCLGNIVVEPGVQKIHLPIHHEMEEGLYLIQVRDEYRIIHQQKLLKIDP